MALDKDEFKKLTTALFYAEKLNVMGRAYTPLEVVMNILSGYSEDTSAKLLSKKTGDGDSFALQWETKSE